MKTFYRNVFIIFIMLIFGCLQQKQNFVEKENEMIKKEVKEQFNQLISALNNLDSLVWSEFYSKDEFLSAFVSTDFYADRGEFIDSIAHYFSLRENQYVEPLELQISVLTPKLVLMTSQEKIEMRLKNGENIKSKHVLTLIWKKEQGGWKIIHSHESWIVE
jgi:ketosteroid isomerase-like protein